MVESIYKTFVHCTKIPWRFWEDVYYVLQMIEKNYALKYSLIIGIGLWILRMIDLLIIWAILKILNQLIILIYIPCLEKLGVMNLLNEKNIVI